MAYIPDMFRRRSKLNLRARLRQAVWPRAGWRRAAVYTYKRLIRLPGTPHFRNVVATAIEQARQMESKEVCTEHLLLALLREKGSVAYRALKQLGINHPDIKTDVLAIAS